MHRFTVVGLFLAAAALAALAPAQASLFSSTEPELIYRGAGPDLEAGVMVIRDAETFARAIEPLDPAFGGPPPDTKKRTVLRIVGRPRENSCRDTVLLEVSTEGTRATAKLEEQVPSPNCKCAADARPPKVFMVTVTRWVRNARVLTSEAEVPCAAAAQPKAPDAAKSALIFEGAWDKPAGVKLITEAADYRAVLSDLGLADRGPVVDFDKDRVVVVTGRARENSCRRTRVVGAQLASKEDLVVEIEEVFAGPGQMCAQVMMLPQVFLYRVPSTVMNARAVTKELR